MSKWDTKLAEAGVLARLAANSDDTEAWKEFYAITYPYVYSLMYRSLHGVEAQVDDAAQDVYLKLINGFLFSDLRDSAAFPSFFKAICRNVLIDNFRKRSRIAAHRAAGVVDVDEIADTQSPMDQLATDELFEAAQRRLSPRDAEIIRLLLSGLSAGEISAAQNVRLPIIYARIHRARNSLRRILAASQG